jgi:hypothetical protein
MPPNARAGWGIDLVMGILLVIHLSTGKHKVHRPNWGSADASTFTSAP